MIELFGGALLLLHNDYTIMTNNHGACIPLNPGMSSLF